MVEPLLIPDDLDRHKLIGLVVVALEGLPEAALANRLEDLVAVTQVILHDYLIVASVVVEALVVRLLAVSCYLGRAQT